MGITGALACTTLLRAVTLPIQQDRHTAERHDNPGLAFELLDETFELCARAGYHLPTRRVGGAAIAVQPPHPHGALLLADYLLAPEGRAVLESSNMAARRRIWASNAGARITV
jgi:hypothetical protein